MNIFNANSNKFPINTSQSKEGKGKAKMGNARLYFELNQRGTNSLVEISVTCKKTDSLFNFIVPSHFQWELPKCLPFVAMPGLADEQKTP